MSELPAEIQERIKQLSAKYNVSEEELLRQYWEIYNSPFVQQDPQFKNDMDRHLYSIRVLVVRIAAQPPAKEVLVIPFGFAGPRVSKTSGMRQSRIYVMAKTGEGWQKGVIVCRGAQADLINDVLPFHAYRVKVSVAGNVMFATTFTAFQDPRPIPVTPLDFLVRYVGVEVIRIIDTPNKLSRMKDRFVDEFDLKLIRGVVIRYNWGRRPDGTEWAVYTISDDSIIETTVTPDGKLIPAQFTVWVPKRLLLYDVDSEVAVVGTVQLNAEGEPFMNAIMVVPIHARPIPPEVLSGG